MRICGELQQLWGLTEVVYGEGVNDGRAEAWQGTKQENSTLFNLGHIFGFGGIFYLFLCHVSNAQNKKRKKKISTVLISV